MKIRFATLLTLLAVLPAAPALAQDGGGTGGASPDDAPLAPLTVGGLRGGDVDWSGTVSGPGNVVIERLDEAGGTWSQVATATAGDDGTFDASWDAGDTLAAYTVRAVLAGTDAGAAPTTRVTIFRGAKATWYGPGLYGRRLACGGRLRTSTLGVAHKKLPCGTPVSIFYNGRSITVPVVDRGPFANGASYDLTAATADALGMKQTARVGVLPKPAAATAKKKPKRRS
jgi:rare lipoprotein A (peptidoglycan hydrolase)